MQVFTFHRVPLQHLLHPWGLQTPQKQSLGGSSPPRHCGGGHSSQRPFPALSCCHCSLSCRRTPCSPAGSPDAWWVLKKHSRPQIRGFVTDLSLNTLSPVWVWTGFFRSYNAEETIKICMGGTKSPLTCNSGLVSSLVKNDSQMEEQV